MVTIATHNGSTLHRGHNMREKKVVEKEEHIDPDGHYEIWYDEMPEKAYHKIFDDAVRAYNAKQKRKDRQITDYYKQIKNDAKKHPVYELLVGVYPQKEQTLNEEEQTLSQETQKEILKEYFENWKERNPNLYICGAYFHADEQGEPHLHIDYIPVGYGYKRGMQVQSSLSKALQNQGFTCEKYHETEQIQWERKENAYLESLCVARGFQVDHPIQEKREIREHLQTEMYKEQKNLEDNIEHVADLFITQNTLRSKISDLKRDIDKLVEKRNEAEKQAQKALVRMQKALSKSYKKENNRQYSYDKGLADEIKGLIEERAEDAKEISHTQLDIEHEYGIASASRKQAEEEAEKLKQSAESELKRAEEYKNREAAYILGQAERRAKEMFREFIDREFSEPVKGREHRLEEYCQSIHFNDGASVLDRFNAEEKKLQKKLERAWEHGFSR